MYTRTRLTHRNDVVNVFDAHRHSDQVLGHTRGQLLIVRELLVRRSRWRDDERLCIADIGQVRSQLQPVHKARASLDVAFDSKGQDTSGPSRQHLLGQLMAWVAGQARIRDPVDLRVLLKPLSQSQGVVGMPLSSQRQRFEALEEQEATKGVQSGAQITQDDDTQKDGVGDGTKGVPELEAVVSE